MYRLPSTLLALFLILPTTILSSPPPVSFHESMTLSPEKNPGQLLYSIEQATADISWHLAKELYEKHLVDSPDYSPTPRIPKIIHHIWLGSPLPEECKKLRETWIKHHPDWQFMLWTDKEVEQFKLINIKRYRESNNYGERADIVRYEVLERFGGLYVDTDFECLKPFDTLHHHLDFYACVDCYQKFEVLNGLIASRPGHPILKECIYRLKNFPSPNSSSIIHRTGPHFFTTCIIRILTTTAIDKVVLLPTSYMYPWPSYARKNKSREEIEAWIRPESMAVHHWHISWLNKKIE
jgi:mannosyltransferase OCH1-like enzyme